MKKLENICVALFVLSVVYTIFFYMFGTHVLAIAVMVYFAGMYLGIKGLLIFADVMYSEYKKRKG